MVSINNLQLTPVRTQNGLTFFASFIVDDAFQVSNIGIYTRMNGEGFRAVYPEKRLPNGTSIPLFYPINRDVGDYIENLITQEANRLLL